VDNLVSTGRQFLGKGRVSHIVDTEPLVYAGPSQQGFSRDKDRLGAGTRRRVAFYFLKAQLYNVMSQDFPERVCLNDYG